MTPKFPNHQLDVLEVRNVLRLLLQALASVAAWLLPLWAMCMNTSTRLDGDAFSTSGQDLIADDSLQSTLLPQQTDTKPHKRMLHEH